MNADLLHSDCSGLCGTQSIRADGGMRRRCAKSKRALLHENNCFDSLLVLGLRTGLNGCRIDDFGNHWKRSMWYFATTDIQMVLSWSMNQNGIYSSCVNALNLYTVSISQINNTGNDC